MRRRGRGGVPVPNKPVAPFLRPRQDFEDAGWIHSACTHWLCLAAQECAGLCSPTSPFVLRTLPLSLLHCVCECVLYGDTRTMRRLCPVSVPLEMENVIGGVNTEGILNDIEGVASLNAHLSSAQSWFRTCVGERN